MQALDDNAVDSMSVGLYAAPSATVTGAACVFNLPVACAVPATAQVPLAFAGTNKSTAPSGVRRTIKDWLTANLPDGGVSGDSFPLYAALTNAFNDLRAVPGPGPRTLLVITDGGINCNQISSRPGYGDCGTCDHEWEAPDNVVSLIAGARSDPTKPISTYFIGLPGSDTAGGPLSCTEAPYHMKLALSAMAFAGSSHTVAGCTGTTFT